MSYIKIVGKDYSLIDDCIKDWESDNKYIFKTIQKARDQVDTINEIKEKIKRSKNQDIKNKTQKELEDFVQNSEELNNLKKFYKELTKELALVDANNIISVGHQEDVIHKISDYKLYDDYKGERFGNIIGSIRKKYNSADFTKYKGLVGLERTQEIEVIIEITSRFDNDAPYFLLTMLTKGKLKFNDYRIPEDKENSLFDCFLLWRLRESLLEAYKKGIYHTYHSFEENGNRIRGSINFAQHIKLNVGQKNGKVAYCYREKTADNYLNHLILTAYEHLKKKYYELTVDNIDSDPEVHLVINMLKNETNFPQYDKRQLLKKCLSTITHPYYTEYEELRKTCLAILRDEGFSILGGNGKEVPGILYYIPDLWEEFLETQMTGLNVGSQNENIIRVISDKFETRPDFVYLTNEKNPFMIMDAKYKIHWQDVHKDKKVGFDKVSNDIDKCIRDMNSRHAHATGVIFPYEGSSNANMIKRHKITDENTEDSFYTVAMRVPKIEKSDDERPESYVEWRRRFDDSVKETVDEMRIIAEREENYYHSIDEVEQQLHILKDIDLKTQNEGQLFNILSNLQNSLVQKEKNHRKIEESIQLCNKIE